MKIAKPRQNKVSTTCVSKETYYACCRSSASLNSRLDIVLSPEIIVGVEGENNHCEEEDEAIIAATNYLNADLHLGGSKTI